MKKIIVLILLLMTVSISYSQNKTLYDFKAKDIDGKEFDFANLKGKKVLIVNVASLCVRTPQYEKLQNLYTEYKDDGNFVIIGFPSNDFGEQEPGSNEEIKEFCSLVYSVTFPMMGKVEVKGNHKAPIYQWLTQKKKNGSLDAEVISNFQKFMIDREGHVVAIAHPDDDPFTDKILDWIEDDE